MVNSNEKLKYSIGVDSLALLSACHLANIKTSWELHSSDIDYSKNLKLSAIAIIVKNLQSKGKTVDGITEHSIEEEKFKVVKREIESLFKKIRADLNSDNGKLTIEQVDTADCNKIRVTIESAIKWASDILEIDISNHFPQAIDEDDDSIFVWGATKTKNNLEYVAVLFELLLENQTQSKLTKINKPNSLTALLKQIAERCQTVEGVDKTRTVRNLHKLALSVKDNRTL